MSKRTKLKTLSNPYFIRSLAPESIFVMLPLSIEQAIVFSVLAAALILFVWGRWRYDIVALLALLVVAVTGIVSIDQVFVGVAHPAVVTVVAVLVISRGLINSGLVGTPSGSQKLETAPSFKY